MGHEPEIGKPEHDGIEIVIQPDGRVVFRVLTGEMLDLAERLAPQSSQVRRRVAMRRRAERRGAHEAFSDG